MLLVMMTIIPDLLLPKLQLLSSVLKFMGVHYKFIEAWNAYWMSCTAVLKQRNVNFTRPILAVSPESYKSAHMHFEIRQLVCYLTPSNS